MMTMTKPLNIYQNGDFRCCIYEDGTFTKESNVDNPEAAFPSTIDVKITDYCDANCAYCFTSEMLISTPEGHKQISNIKINDEIICLDLQSNSITRSIVDNIYSRFIDEDILVIELDNGDIIRCTSSHKILTDQGFIEASNLTIDSNLISQNELSI